MGIKCNVFNCTDSLDITAMSKFFKGLTSSGCWCCFDEFNRIDPEVLSVIAQQIQTIQNALKGGRPTFIFNENEEIAIISTMAINITMNPTYAGRHDLPDNLKALFRPCAMMVADYFMIAQIKLLSYGYQQARVIANKVVSSLKLSSEQLSTQTHYDYGMRSLNAILLASGKMKKKFPQEDEERLALRALYDINMPKFTSNDVPLFALIIRDLFPDVQILPDDLSQLEESLKASCEKLKLQAKPTFIKKCLQLYETANVRHALMIVGTPGYGKSKVIQVLKEGISALKGVPGFNTVEASILNPKSLIQKQLYGFFDRETKEWRKGLLQVKMSDLIEKDKEVKKWLIFDGPVDTLWIENMNSLLDDNKKLCLEDSSSIPLGDNMNIIFEVDDLKGNSPATVSRNGMVLCELDTLDFEDMIKSYSNNLPKCFDAKQSGNFRNISIWILKPILAYLYKNAKFAIPIDRLHLVKSFIDMFECFLKDFRIKDQNELEGTFSKPQDPITLDKIENFIINSILVAILGPVIRPPKFQEFLNDLIMGNDVNEKYNLDITDWEKKKLTINLIHHENIFDLVYYKDSWTNWFNIVEKFIVKPEMKFNELIIPNQDTIKIIWLMDMLTPSRKHLLVTGSTGTGKTLSVLSTLNNKYETDSHTYIKLNFTAQTTAEQTQSSIEFKMQKSYRKFSPTKSRKGIIFIDDLNMPAKEKFGAQPPIELLRQWMDYGGWFDLASETKDFINIIDVSFIGAMGSVASGRTISSRYLRHFTVFNVESYSNITMTKIFSEVIEWFFISNKKPPFEVKVRNLKEQIVDASINIYLKCSAEFKATPAKTHYTFNLRDVSKIFQGISKSNAKVLLEENDLIKLFVHESERIFKDRLIDKKDRDSFDRLIADVCKSNLRRDYHNLTKEGPILFGDFVPVVVNPEAEKSKQIMDKNYTELVDKTLLKKILQEHLTNYNNNYDSSSAGKSSEGVGSLNLVLFNYAIDHTVRIARIINTAGGNALLVGMGGSGRKSLTTLASAIYSHTIFQFELPAEAKIADWKDCLKTLMKDYFTKDTLFILSDTQITNENYFEDINNLLNNGEIPNLINLDDLQNIKESMGNDDKNKKNQSDSEVYAEFVDRCKEKIHIILCVSPIGESFRKRAMMFPSLVNCTTIDWFLEWPVDALVAVAHEYLHKATFPQNYLNDIVNICVDMQERVIKYSEKYKLELRRYYYVTPMSFIELLNLFESLIRTRSKEVKDEIDKFTNGLAILEVSEKTAKEMSQYIEIKLKPELTKKKSECSEKIKQVTQLNEETKKEEEEAAIIEINAVSKEKLALEISELANKTLKIIEEEKDSVAKAIDLVKGDHIAQIRKYVNDAKVTEYLKYLCILMMDKPHDAPFIKNADPKAPKERDYYKHGMENIFAKQDFLKKVKEYAKTEKSDLFKQKMENQVELRALLTECNTPFEQKSNELAILYGVLKSHNKLYFINLEYIPTKKKAEEAAEDVRVTQLALKESREKLAAIRATKERLNKEKEDLETQVKILESELDQCERRLKNAEELVKLLADEKKDWENKKVYYKKDYKNILGDILISSGVIAYLGVFTKTYRLEITDAWSEMVEKANIPFTPSDYPMQRCLGDKMTIEEWKMKKLPNDAFSADNALIMNKSTRWSLLIDPQNQANEWIVETFKDKTTNIESFNKKNKQKVQEISTFHSIKPTTDSNQMVKIATECIDNGYTLLYENVGETLNPSLNPLYKKEYSKDPGSLNSFIISLSKGNKTTVHKKFNFFITTKLPKPHYSPEICVNLTLVNFTVTEEGMEDQMLNFLVAKEDPATESLRIKSIEEVNKMNQQKRQCETKILGELNSTDKEKILDNVVLIATLKESKSKSKEADISLAKAAESEEKIKKIRGFFKPIAFYVGNLFFTIADLSNIEPVYQYSLNWYKDIFSFSIGTTQAMNVDKTKKIDTLKENFTSFLYDKVCISLFEKDKLVFSFMLMTKLYTIQLAKQEDKVIYNKETR